MSFSSFQNNKMGTNMVFDSMRLYLGSDRYFIQPIDSSATLVIDRILYDITVEQSQPDIPINCESKIIYGVLGIIKLISGPHLVVITERSVVGEITGQLIWQVTKTEVLPYVRNTFMLNPTQQQYNKTYEQMLQQVLNTTGLYFSCTSDLTHTLQRLYNTTSDFSTLSIFERADARFVWNHHLLREFQNYLPASHHANFLLPVVCGFVSIKPVSMKGHNFTYMVISRRSVFRAGTRYTARGLDSEGHPANYVETEQIIEYDYTKCSVVTTRGSIPFYWSQKVNIKYKPKCVIQNEPHVMAFKNHFATQLFHYGKQVLVNLVNLTGSEGALADHLSKCVKDSNEDRIRLESFDFHKQCGQKRWDRLSVLMERLEAERQEFGYFMLSRGGAEVKKQSGVFRVNCMDCLDRTNVVQAMLCKRTLKDQLVKLGILNATDRLEDQAAFDFVYRNLWADNADNISLQYAGTGALKTDFTRTGRRTTAGMAKDLWNSAVRYVRNNFSDGFRQDAIDLFLGNHIVDPNEGGSAPSPLDQSKDLKVFLVPVVMLITCAMFTFNILMPAEEFSETLPSLLFWGGMCIASIATIYVYGKDFVDVPKLSSKEKKD